MKLTRKLLLLSATLLLLLNTTALATVLLLARIEGPPLQVLPEKMTEGIQYSPENTTSATWDLPVNLTLEQSWYCRLNITKKGYWGSVNILWFLERLDNSVWVPFKPYVNVTTVCYLSGSVGQLVYASSDGTITTNMNWLGEAGGLLWPHIDEPIIESLGTFRIVAEISKI